MRDLLYLKDEQIKDFIQLLFYAYRETFADPKKILAKINGLNPNPGAWVEYKNERYKIWQAKIIESKGETGFTINDKLTIACKEDSIQILEVQKEGKSKLSLDKFLLGNEIKTGENII